MKAVIWTQYGPPDVLKLRDVEKPVPREDELLIKVRASNATTGDCEMRNLEFPVWIRFPMRFYVGLWKPTRVTILGGYLAGEIEAVGENVKQFRVGDQVFGFTGFRFGTYAEYICLPENGFVVLKPTNMSYEEAATVPLGGLEALHFLRKANIQPGQSVLINGAGGSIGTFAVQLAKHYGAEVTAVDSREKMDMLRSIGADHVMDYTSEDFAQNGRLYDVILDVVLNSSFTKIVNSLTDTGIYLMTNPTMPKMIRAAGVSRNSDKKVIFEFTNPSIEDLRVLKGVIEAGHLKAVIDRCYRLDQAVEAHHYIESGQKIGNVVISLD